MLIPGGVLGMAIWLLYLLLKGPTNVIIATFVAAIIGSCVNRILSIIYKTPAVVLFWLFWPLGPRLHFLSDDCLLCHWWYSQAMIHATLVVRSKLWSSSIGISPAAPGNPYSSSTTAKSAKPNSWKQTVEPSAVFILKYMLKPGG